MYTTHFGLTEPPFSITPDPRYVYMSERHREALAHLLYGIGETGGFVQLTGEIGTGKTTLSRCLLGQLPPEVDVALILNPKVTDIELLATLCTELRIDYPTGTTSRMLLVNALYQYLLDAHARGRRTVLIIDEAQDLAPEVLEQIRLLTNLETTTQKLLQIILIGQPELIRLLEREDLRQIAQRVTARYHLLPGAEADTYAYIRHRMQVAGQKKPVFTDAAMREVHRASRGFPRLINAICDRALLGAYAHEGRLVNAATVRRAAGEVLGQHMVPRSEQLWRWAAVAAVAVIAVAAVVTGIWIFVSHRDMRLMSSGITQAPAISPPAASSAPPAVPPPAPPPAVGSAPLAPPDGKIAAVAPAQPPPFVPVPGAREVKPAAPKQPSLGEMLSNPSVRADRKSAFATLYASWGVDFESSANGLACDRGRPEGLRCLFKTGTWAKLRRFNLPAIIELATSTGDRRYATVIAVEDQAATLDFGGQRRTFPLGEVDLYWDGPFILLWREPALTSRSIVPGARGKDVEWVRQRLSELDGGAVGGRDGAVFDEDLRNRVIAFQRSRSLIADGIVGEETLTHLTTAARDPRVPRLSRAGS
jgi:general secretion pathway protein A